MAALNFYNVARGYSDAGSCATADDADALWQAYNAHFSTNRLP